MPITQLPAAQDTAALEATQIPSEEHPQERQASQAIIKLPLTAESTMKTEDNTLMLTVAVKANKYQIRQTMKKLYDTV
ncbi:60S ribosomal protein L23a [Heterocephalus glaber]|uniref:60S ribosomal protein L23a n=1 Tax=Heterocephalus glaber TaxID=10181 RepID=G5C6V7_HETGA|nr:60S ribosomal protein L23a [Heterocephalus glaber]